MAQRRIENPLARRVLSGEIAPGDTVAVDVTEAGEYTFAQLDTAAEAATAAVA